MSGRLVQDDILWRELDLLLTGSFSRLRTVETNIATVSISGLGLSDETGATSGAGSLLLGLMVLVGIDPEGVAANFPLMNRLNRLFE